MLENTSNRKGKKGKANKAIKYRLYPTKEQAELFAKTFGCCRKVYNLMLTDEKESYEKTGKFVTVTPVKYKKEYPYLKEVDSLALANKQLDLQAALRNCFSKTRKKKNGFPKYKSAKHSRKSYTTNNQKGTIALYEKELKLPKVGKIKAVIHRKPKEGWQIKSATISQESDGSFFAFVLFEFDPPVCDYVADLENVIGLDYASNGLYVDHNGQIGSNHKYYRESQEKLAKEQRKLSRKVGSKKNETKSKNYLKQLKKINKIHRHIANQRLDHLHKKSTEIANQYDVVCVESLNLRAISNKGFGNGKAPFVQSTVVFGRCHLLETGEKAMTLLKQLAMKYYPTEQLVDEEIARLEKAVQVFEIEIEHMSGKEIQER